MVFITRFNLVLLWTKIGQILTKKSSKWVRHNQVSWSSLKWMRSVLRFNIQNIHPWRPSIIEKHTDLPFCTFKCTDCAKKIVMEISNARNTWRMSTQLANLGNTQDHIFSMLTYLLHGNIYFFRKNAFPTFTLVYIIIYRNFDNMMFHIKMF